MIAHLLHKEKSVKGRYVNLDKLQKEWMDGLDMSLIKYEGRSVLGENIFSVQLGFGKRRVLIWSQMHGNESTTTKAVLDAINFLKSDEILAKSILTNCTLLIIPILNPDGAKAYTRNNANNVDLNRDAKLRSQPESKILNKLFSDFKPDFCFNLHDQRTLFSVGNTNKSATVSFLSPSTNLERSVDKTRSIAMKIIVAMNELLQKKIPGQVGRYDDGFNDNCVGDFFQMQGVPTILIEAGHFPEDYQREKTRELIFLTIIDALKIIATDSIDNFKTADYFQIPENKKQFFDILIANPKVINQNLMEKDRIGIRFKEVLNNNTIVFQPELTSVGHLEGFFGHQTFDCTLTEDYQRLTKRPDILNLILSAKD
ncbi:Metallocarboxypeptidase D [Flagellimonas maritima]|uniref:Metallocarboxypeptidase D n=1 Tax=Flagellimonas maritima TaxID=1383885 RepID=A0A2Z4LWA9_9FLAO|nr:M14 metallopeptidase family protein [Allomuricauda aurantiaca]AWX46019.1 Metallocarboxypeptidase D [Allomuricauda aurantiaca]